MSKIRIIFWGTPAIAAQTLQHFINDDRYDVVAAVSQPDKPSGRGRTVSPTPVKQVALEHNIPIYQPTKLKKNDELHEQLRSHKADYFVVIAYGKIVPQVILDMPTYDCLNIHGSLLPEYRGAAPLQFVLLDGKEATGVTLMKMSLGMDEGAMIETCTIPLDTMETSGTLFEKMGTAAGPFVSDAIITYHEGGRISHEQDHDAATYTRMLTKEDGELTDFVSVYQSFHQWQGVTPWPGLQYTFDDKRLIITSCIPATSETPLGATGAFIRVGSENVIIEKKYESYMPSELVGIVHQDGALLIRSLKIPGKGEISIEDYVKGYMR